VSDGTLHVDAPALTSAAQSADSAADRMLNRYQAVSAEVAHVLDGRWTGTAAEACRSAWDEWSEGLRMTVMALRDEAQALRSAATSYTSGDDDAASAIDAADLL
jgi:WXG100 family type VII secretion target